MHISTLKALRSLAVKKAVTVCLNLSVCQTYLASKHFFDVTVWEAWVYQKITFFLLSNSL